LTLSFKFLVLTMQTKQQIQQLLAYASGQRIADSVYAPGQSQTPSNKGKGSATKRYTLNASLGQHFLIDLNLMRLLVKSAHIRNDDIVLEVGCGTGSLTEALAEAAGMVIAVERDKALAEIAKRQLALYQSGTGRARAKNVRFINTDILETKSTISRTVTKAIRFAQKKYRGRTLLIANLPYNVACPVMLNLLSGPLIVDSMYVTVQKEVAQRITASPGQKHYGTLSIYLAATGDVKTIRDLKPTVFWPQPKVNSAMLSFVRKKRKASRIKNFELFSNVVHLFMQHRRKMLKTCTKLRFHESRFTIHDLEWPEIFEQCALDPTQRPDQLSPENYIAIANLCHRYLSSDRLE